MLLFGEVDIDVFSKSHAMRIARLSATNRRALDCAALQISTPLRDRKGHSAENAGSIAVSDAMILAETEPGPHTTSIRNDTP
jgi:hypothetical protein